MRWVLRLFPSGFFKLVVSAAPFLLQHLVHVCHLPSVAVRHAISVKSLFRRTAVEHFCRPSFLFLQDI